MGHGVSRYNIDRKRKENGDCVLTITAEIKAKAFAFTSIDFMEQLENNKYLPKNLDETLWSEKAQKRNTTVIAMEGVGNAPLAVFGLYVGDICVEFFLTHAVTEIKVQSSGMSHQIQANVGMPVEKLEKFATSLRSYGPADMVKDMM